MSWLTGWTSRKKHDIRGSDAGAVTDYQVRITVHYGSNTDDGENVYVNGKCKADFSDIRFTDEDGVTKLNYWLQEKVDSDYAIFWVKIPDIPAFPNVKSIYVYYGNPDAESESDGRLTFMFYDDFDDSLAWEYYESRTEFEGGIVSDARTPPKAYRLRKTEPYGLTAGDYNEIRRDIDFAGYTVKIVVDEKHYTGGGSTADAYLGKILVDTTEYLGFNFYRNMNVWKIEETSEITVSGTHTVRLRMVAQSTSTSYNWVIWDTVRIRRYISPEPEHYQWYEEEMQTITVTVTNERLDKEIALLGDLVTYTAIIEADGDAVPDEFIARLIGDSFVMKDNIQFVDAVYDSLTHKLTVTFNVRYGVTRLYWHRWTQISPITIKYPYQTPTGLAWRSADT